MLNQIQLTPSDIAALQSRLIPPALLSTLLPLANAAKQFAHCPYSSFRVGCVVLAKSGHLFSGCNVENASYGAGICAERVAITKAVSEGQKSFWVIVVATDLLEKLCP